MNTIRLIALQETPENAADVPHLAYVHGPAMNLGIDLRKTRTLRIELTEYLA